MPTKKNYPQAKGRRNKDGYFHLPHQIANQKNIAEMSAYAKALLLDLGAQYKGYNNGDLSIVWQFMEKRGWRSKTTLYKARDELLQNNLIVFTQHGDKKRPTLYGFTWRTIDKVSEDISVTEKIKKGDVIGGWKN